MLSSICTQDQMNPFSFIKKYVKTNDFLKI